MNKTLLFSVFIFTALGASAQRLIAKDAFIRFYSSTPMEDIEATTNTAVSVLDKNSGEVAFQVSIKNFTFDRALMQEHFNENYLESEKFPSATFKGKIKESVDLTVAGTYPITAAGSATIHGVTRPIELKGTIVSTGTNLALTCAFEVKLVDYKVAIPKIVFAKIAEVIKVSSKINYSKK